MRSVLLWLGLFSAASFFPCAAAESRMAAAWSEVSYLNFRGALRLFRAEQQGSAPGGEAWLESSLGLALCYQHRQPDTRADKEKAAALYDRIIQAAAGNPIQALALLLRARLADQVDYYGDKPDPETARKLYSELLEKWPSSPLVHRAVLYLAQLDIFSMSPAGARRGIQRLRAWLGKHPHNPLAYLQWELIALASMDPLHDPRGAVQAFEHAEAAGLPSFTQWDAFYWRLANLALEAGDKPTAARYFRRIITRVKRSGFAYEAQQRLREMGIEPPPLPDPFAASDSRKPGKGTQEPQ